jgi:RNA polymerase sigma-70 factor (ECF subfamily)
VPVLVNGSAGGLLVADGKPFALLGFTISSGKIREIDVFSDPERLARLGLDRFMRS